MLLRLASRFVVSSSVLSPTSTYIPARLANTFIDEEYIRKNVPTPDQSISSTTLRNSPSNTNTEPMTFAKMFRQSKFVQLGGLKGRLISGRIVDVIDDDLYVDFGGKFNAVVQRPQNKQRDQYTIGAVVSIRLQSWEMAARFLGASRHISLLEADAQLVGLLRRVDRTVKPRGKDIDLRYRPGDSRAPTSMKREVL